MRERYPVFHKIAGSRQIMIRTARDLAAAAALDPAHWAVTGMPTDSIIYEPDFLKLVDTDKNNRIRPDELKNAIHWLLDMMADRTGIEEGSRVLKLSAINKDADGAGVILAAAHIILQNLGIPEKDEITLDQVMDRMNLVLNSCGNGDGVITAENNDNALLAEYVRDAIFVCGSVPDVTGLPGIDLEITEKFRGELEHCHKWHLEEKGEALFPFWEKTGEFYSRYIELESEIDRYFVLCHAISGNGAGQSASLMSLDPLNNQGMSDFMANAPCAMPDPECILSATGWLNPEKGLKIPSFIAMAHELRMAASPEKITEQEWRKVIEKLKQRKEWLSRTPTGNINTLPEEKIREYLEKDVSAMAVQLIEKDRAVKEEIEAYASLKKLILYQHCMIEYVNNFINLSRLFNPDELSLIQPGHLIMDGRHYTLCCRVMDVATHKKIIQRSNICVMYIALSTGLPENFRTMNLAVAITSGSMRDIFVGRTGVFVGKDGTEWDARVIDFVQQPVSLGEAIQMPFIRFGEFLERQADRFFSSKSKTMETNVGTDLSKGKVPGDIVQTAAGKQTPAISGSMMLMGGEIGIAALGSAFALIVNTLKSIPVWNVIVVLLGIIFIISAPMVMVSIIKLCRRHVSDFLAASGWAVNPRMRLSNRMGLIFTHIPPRPSGAKYLYRDIASVFSKGFVDKKARFRVIFYWIFAGLVLCGIGFWIYLKWYR